MTLTKTVLSAFSALAISGAVASSAQAQFVSNPVSNSHWAGVNDNGGLGGSFDFLNSNGGNPFTSGPWFNGVWTPTDAVFSANFGSAGTISNSGSWDGSNSIQPFGSTDTTSYGELFDAPTGATLSEFDFLIENNFGTGTNATFVLATWNSGAGAPGTELFSESSFVSTASGFVWNTNAVPDIALTSGDEYVAFLTVSNSIGGVPELSTWAMMFVGFAGLGLAGYRKAKTGAAFSAA